MGFEQITVLSLKKITSFSTSAVSWLICAGVTEVLGGLLLPLPVVPLQVRDLALPIV